MTEFGQLDSVEFEVARELVKGPYPGQKRHKSDVEGRSPRRVVKSRDPIPLGERSPATHLMDERHPASDPPPDPVQFFRYDHAKQAGPKDPVKDALDISGADSESGVVLLSGNWFCQYSTDAGSSFTSVDPTTIFPAWPGHAFCCDQVVTYVPSIDRFVWFMQHQKDAKGIGAFRLAAASPAAIKKDFAKAWNAWQFTAKDFDLTEDLDYPDLSFTGQFLHVATDATTTAGRLVLRVALKDIASAPSSLRGRFTHPDNAKSAIGAHLVQDSRDGAYWVGQPDNSKLQVFSWPDSGTGYSWYTIGVSAWPQAKLSSKGPNGNDWLSFLNGSSVRYQESGGTRKGDELWIAWTASSGSGSSGGPSFKNTHVRVAVINLTSKIVSSESQVWNNDYAFAYPSLCVNGRGDVGIAVAVGGTKNDAHTSVGILGDHTVWHVDQGDFTPTRWGDYVTVREHHRNQGLFAGFGYYNSKDPTNNGKYEGNPFYVVYGRKSVGP
jgi:hypothetical protein